MSLSTSIQSCYSRQNSSCCRFPTAARAHTTRLPSTRPVPHHHTQPRAETLHIYKPPYRPPSAHLPSMTPNILLHPLVALQLLSASWRKQNLNQAQSDAVRAAFNGNANAQFQPYKGWRFSGFGIINHLRGLRCTITTVPAGCRALATALNVAPEAVRIGSS